MTKDCANHNLSYCLWKKSCTSWYGKYPIIYRILYIPSGCLGFLPSKVWLWIGWLPLWFPKTVDSQFSDPGFASRYPNQTPIVHLSLRSGKWPCVLLPSETSRVLVLEINACLRWLGQEGKVIRIPTLMYDMFMLYFWIEQSHILKERWSGWCQNQNYAWFSYYINTEFLSSDGSSNGTMIFMHLSKHRNGACLLDGSHWWFQSR